MKYIVLSRAKMEQLAPTEPHIFISISTPWKKDGESTFSIEHAQLHVSGLTRGVLQMGFVDVGDMNAATEADVLSREPDLPIFTEGDAGTILDFVRPFLGTDLLCCVHCDAGWSRSPAVAAALTRIEGGDDSAWFRDRFPNGRVYREIISLARARGLLNDFISE